MHSDQLPRAVLVRARERSALAEQELAAACQRAHTVAAEKDWLAERPDLQQLQREFREAERRSDQYHQAWARLTPPWIRARIRALSPHWSIGCDRAIDEVITAYHALLRRYVSTSHLSEARTDLISTILRLDPELDLPSASLLLEILNADTEYSKVQDYLALGPQVERFVRESIDAFINCETREHQAAYEASVKKVADARRAVIALFRQRLEQRFTDAPFEDFVPEGDHSLRLELEDIKTAHGRKRQEEQSRRQGEYLARVERQWWDHLETQPIDAILERLDKVPKKRFSAVLRRLLAMSDTDRRIHNDKVQTFFRQAYRSLFGSPEIVGPLLVACLGRLIAEGDVKGASAILDWTPVDAGSPLKDVVAYLRFIAAKPAAFGGKAAFDKLSPADLFLGACYYGKGFASDLLDKKSQWNDESLQIAQNSDDNDNHNHALSDFTARGLQPQGPRI